MNIRMITLYLAAAIILLMTGCSEEHLQEDMASGENRVLSLNASMPQETGDDKNVTRIALNQEEDWRISLSWQSGDVLNLLFVQSETKIGKTVTINETDISTDGKRATFEILLPDEIIDGNFDLYIVYGGGGLLENDPTIAILPENPGNSESLTSVQDRKDVMLTFSEKGISTSNASVNANFNHLGSLFSITLKNSSTTSITNLSEARLVSSEGGWAYNNGTGAKTYNLITSEFMDAGSAGDYLSFKAPESTVSADGLISFWGWYPPLPDKAWPELNLELISTDNQIIQTTTNALPARTEATLAGKSYYFFAAWDGTNLEFTNSEFGTAPDLGDLTLLEYIDAGSNPSLTSYPQVINHASLSDAVTVGNRTRIVPTNSAITSILNLFNATTIEEIPNNILKEIFSYLIIDGEVLSSGLIAGQTTNFTSLNGDNIYLTLDNGKLYINNGYFDGIIEVIEKDLQFKDGVAHLVDIVPFYRPDVAEINLPPTQIDLPYLKNVESYLLEDSHVAKGFNNTNYDESNTFQVAARVDDGNYTKYAYLKLELPTIDFIDELDLVKLRINCSNIAGDGYVPIIGVYPTSNDWNETTITWNNKPEFGDKLFEFNVVTGTNEIDITDYIKQSYTENKDSTSVVFRALNGETIASSNVSFYQRKYHLAWAIPKVTFSGGGYVSELNLVNNAPLNVSNGGTFKITKDQLSMESKVDAIYSYADNNIIYTVSSLPSNGFITVYNLPLKVGDSFTQAELDNGVVKYIHNGLNLNNDSYQLRVTDFIGGVFSTPIEISVLVD